MSSAEGTSNGDLLRDVLLPVANEEDAIQTANALAPYQPTHVTAMYIVEKGKGVPDKLPIAQSEAIAEDSFAAVQSVFPDADTHTAYNRDIIDAIFDAAEEENASAIAFRARGDNRLLSFLSGDYSFKLVTQAERPVIALPRADRDE